MLTYMIGVVSERLNGLYTLGFRLLNTNTMEYTDEAVESVYNMIKKGLINEENLTVNDSNDGYDYNENQVKIIGDNKYRYPEIVNGEPSSAVRLTLIGKLKNSNGATKYLCTDVRGYTYQFTLQELIDNRRNRNYDIVNIVLEGSKISILNNSNEIPTIEGYKNEYYIDKNYINKCRLLNIVRLNFKKIDGEIRVVGTYKISGGKEIIVPNFVTIIDDVSFSEHSMIENVRLHTKVESIGNGAFKYCGDLTNIVIPDGVKFIGNNAFKSCYSIRNIKIPESVTYLGEGALSQCYKLKNINMSGSIKNIEKKTFQDCDGLENIDIPHGVERIGTDAFEGCTRLVGVKLPNTLKSIGGKAFSHCTSLKKIEIPESVEELGRQVFYGSRNLKDIKIRNKNIKIYDDTLQYSGLDNKERIEKYENMFNLFSM